jgi:hypothetical protein
MLWVPTAVVTMTRRSEIAWPNSADSSSCGKNGLVSNAPLGDPLVAVSQGPRPRVCVPKPEQVCRRLIGERDHPLPIDDQHTSLVASTTRARTGSISSPRHLRSRAPIPSGGQGYRLTPDRKQYER